MTPPLDARQLLKKYGQRAKKSWGQNFLVDEGAYRAIVDASGATRDDSVLEIGAGLGTLTVRLAGAAGRVFAIERDRELAAILREELAPHDNITLFEDNALTFDYGALAAAQPRPLIVVGNLPYNIATPILFRLFSQRSKMRRIVLMLQREMAERIAASPDRGSYGALSVMVQLYGDAKIVKKVGRGGFVPAPKVESAVLVIELFPDASTRLPVRDEAVFSKVVHAAFGQRRKTLRNALGALCDDVPGWLVPLGIDPQRRGETLTVPEYVAVANALPPRAGAGDDAGAA